jgi:hypothetical protein
MVSTLANFQSVNSYILFRQIMTRTMYVPANEKALFMDSCGEPWALKEEKILMGEGKNEKERFPW